MITSQQRPVIFLVFANDHNNRTRYLRNLPEEARRLRAVLEQAQRDRLCEVVVREDAGPDHLFRLFQSRQFRNRIAVMHFGGHANGYQLFLQSAEGKVEAAHASGLAAFLGQQQGLQLVFLNGCSTQPQAQALLDAHVSAVIATSQAVADEVAMEFASHFYASLTGGASIGTAYEEARAAIATTRGDEVCRLHYEDEPDAAVLSALSPWHLFCREGAEVALRWNLPDAAGDPLFGLPSVSPINLPKSPYRHLRRFDRAHTEVFFGRGYQIRELYDRVTSFRSPPIVLLYGQSGVGKSSLLEAGLRPRLEASHVVWSCRRHRERGLLGALRECLRHDEKDVPLVDLWQTIEREHGKPLLVFLDQVEEVFTRPNSRTPQELEELFDALGALFNDPSQLPAGKLILGFRKEWLLEVEEPLKRQKLSHSMVPLEPLDRRGIIEAIIGPAKSARLQRYYGLSVEEGLPESMAETLLADKASPVAPILQILLARMWERARQRDQAHPHFDQYLYQGLKREGLHLNDFLDRQLSALERRQFDIVNSGLALDVLAFHTTARGTAEERTAQELDSSYGHRLDVLPTLIQHCRDSYLLVEASEKLAIGHGTSRLSHDTLAPLIRERFEASDRPGQRARRILESRAVEWAKNRQGTPLDETDLQTVQQGFTGMRAWTVDEQRLVENSQLARLKRRRVRRLQAGLGVLLMASVAIAGVLFWMNERELTGKHVTAMLLSQIGLYPVTPPEMVEIRPGSFWMGLREDQVEENVGDNVWASARPLHEVRIQRPFKIGKYEVTYAEFLKFVYATGRALPRPPDGLDAAETPDSRPVAYVSWSDAVQYTKWLSAYTHQTYRLPTEAEWEYVARAGTTSTRFWGDTTNEACSYANIADQGHGKTFPKIHDCTDGEKYTASIGKFRANGFLLHDIIGNVWEWVLDCAHVNYEGAPGDGSLWNETEKNCERRVIRGGSYSNDPTKANSIYRGTYRDYETQRLPYIGLRIVQEN